jgi:hypothetical protein
MTRWAGRLSRRVGVAALAAAVCMAGSARAGAAVGRAAAGPGEVPAGFKANSITWLSQVQGWVLGAAPCGTKTCTDVIGTTNGSRTWGLLGTINAAIPEKGLTGTGVTEIRFVTPDLGFAFAPDLYVTGNGGRSWAQVAIPGNGKQILDLATGAGRAYAVVSPCAFETGLCSSASLGFWRTTTSTGRSWAHVPLKLAASVAAQVAAYGHTVYVVDESSGQADRTARDQFYASTDAGDHFSIRPDPCDLEAQKDRGLSGVAPASPTTVALLCIGAPGLSQAPKTAYLSASTGRTDLYAGQMGLFGIQSELAMSPSGNLAVASVSDGSFIYINDTHKTTWTMVIGYGDGGVGWNDITYVTDSQAWVVYGPVDSPADLGKVFVTRNAGRTWDVVAL